MPPKKDQSLPFLTRRMLDFDHGATFTLIVEIITGVQEDLFLRGFTKEGPFRFRVRPEVGTAEQTFSFRIPDFPIMLTLGGEGQPNATGRTQVTVHLDIDGTKYAILMQGHVSGSMGLSWPFPVHNTFLQDYGDIHAVNTNDPAAGAEPTITVPDNEFWLLQDFSITLVTDANAGNRRPALKIVGFGSNNALYPSAALVSASKTMDLVWAPGAGIIDDTDGVRQSMPMIENFIAKPSTEITLETTGLKAGDNYELGTLRIRRYFTLEAQN